MEGCSTRKRITWLNTWGNLDIKTPPILAAQSANPSRWLHHPFGFQLYFHFVLPKPYFFPINVYLMSLVPFWHYDPMACFRPKASVKTSRLFWGEFGWLIKGLSSTPIPIPRSNLGTVDSMHIYKPTEWTLVRLDDIFSGFIKLNMASALTNVHFVSFPQPKVCRHMRINTNCKRDTTNWYFFSSWGLV